MAVYTSHLDYLDDAYYNVRGYDGSTWEEIPIPTTVEEVLERNVASQRDDAIKMFIEQAKKDREAGYTIIWVVISMNPRTRIGQKKPRTFTTTTD